MVITVEILGTAILIFLLRVFNNALSTVRVVMITRDMRLWASTLALIEALTFAVVISSVVKDLTNVFNLTAYCVGFAVGGYVGMAIEARFITSYVVATVITASKGHEMAVLLREKGFGVTEATGEGKDGLVVMLRSVLERRDVPHFSRVVNEMQPAAFVSVEEARAIEHGWIGRWKPNQMR
ncbi:MAG: DUF2179 domain-containing protein [Anaerolineae bacterium]|nr:DUF2179 domain-containing protein [Anaerolineae bacterium]